jgi:GNAT superfamily N-acetyltransferase
VPSQWGHRQRNKASDRDAILKLIDAFNDSKVSPSRFKELAILLRDPRSGATVGGLWGRSAYDWVFVELMFVPEELRRMGLGSQLLQIGRGDRRGARMHGLWLDTFSFQACGFYERHGYTLFGTLEDHPRGARHFFLRKILNVAIAVFT